MADRRFVQTLKALGAALKRRRLELGLTQEDAAHAIGIAVRHYQKLEAGEVNVTVRTLVKVHVAFHIPLRLLF